MRHTTLGTPCVTLPLSRTNPALRGIGYDAKGETCKPCDGTDTGVEENARFRSDRSRSDDSGVRTWELD